MNTQELKEYIGRVLGNSIRCLLPSYWWKRLFGLVVDKVDEVEGRVLEVPELITSSLAEFAEKYPDIESRTFYLEGSTEKIEKNAALLRKVGEEYQNGIVQHVYLATLFNGEMGKLIVTSPQFIVTSGFRFINVATPFFKVLKDVIINEDGTFALEDAEYSVDVDTSKFATTAQLQELDNTLSDEIDGLKDSKQDTISDLETIRSGAALGLTALQEHQDISHLATKTEVEAKYTKPSSGIPKSDLVSEVQESLGKADTAIQNVKTINGNSIEGDGDVSVGSITSVDTGDILDDVDVRYATEQYVDDAIANVDVDTSNLATKEELETLSERLGEKQEKLVSGENIKTINGESVLGSGNITIQGGGSSYDDTELRNSLNAVTERVDDLSSELEDKVNETSLATINGQSLVNEGNVVVGDVVSVATGDVVDDVEMEYATKIYVDNAIAQAIISTINANY